MPPDEPETIWFPLPPTMNEIINVARTSWQKSAKQKKYWTEQAHAAAIGHRQFTGKVWMAWVWHIKNLDRDEDNLASARKFICDGLVAAGIIKDDSCYVIQTPVIHWHVKDKEDKVMCAIASSPNFLFKWMEINRNQCLEQTIKT
jgi:hypothetical protein